jgi:hypothetical protein
MKASDFTSIASNASMAEAAQKIVTDITSYLTLIEAEQTKRLEIQASHQVEVTKIEALRSTLQGFLDRSFEERRQNFENLFKIIRASMESGDMRSLEVSLSAVVELAKISPLAEAKNLSTLRLAMDDPDHEFQL